VHGRPVGTLVHDSGHRESKHSTEQKIANNGQYFQGFNEPAQHDSVRPGFGTGPRMPFSGVAQKAIQSHG
jgi:hypothetical protein